MNTADAETLAESLMVTYSLLDWKFRWDNAKRRHGQCRFRDRVISLSRPLTLLCDESIVRDTILHEIAHALVGSGHGHDRIWQLRAIALGCDGKRCADSNTPQVPGKWIGTCSGGHIFHKYRRPRVRRSCSRCCPGQFSADHIITWREA